MQRKAQASTKIGSMTGLDVLMINESELRAEMWRAVRGQSALPELYRWLMARSNDMHLDSERPAVELAAEVEALFFRRADGEIDDESMQEELRSLLSNIVLSSPLDVSLRAVRARPAFVNWGRGFSRNYVALTQHKRHPS